MTAMTTIEPFISRAALSARHVDGDSGRYDSSEEASGQSVQQDLRPEHRNKPLLRKTNTGRRVARCGFCRRSRECVDRKKQHGNGVWLGGVHPDRKSTRLNSS